MLTFFRQSLPIQIHPLFLVLALMIGWLNAGTVLGTALWALVIFFSVLVHEFGHAVVGLAFDQKPAITLFGMGGLTERRRPTKLKPWKEFLLVFCGPLFGFILALLAKGALEVTPPKLEIVRYCLTITYVVNLFWTILNLFPIHPMDGGKLSMIVLEYFFGIRGIKISLALSFILGAVFGLLFLFFNQIFIGALFLLFAFESWRSFQGSLALSKRDENPEARQVLKEGEELLALGKRQFAKDKFYQVQKMTGKGLLYTQSAIRLAEIAYQEGEYQLSLNHLKALKSYQWDESSLKLKQKALTQLERYQEALEIGEDLFLQHSDVEIAAKNALLAAKLKDEKAALGWLKWIKTQSKPNFNLLINNADFSFLKGSGPFQQLINE
jgi:Zn-dependent protease